MKSKKGLVLIVLLFAASRIFHLGYLSQDEKTDDSVLASEVLDNETETAVAVHLAILGFLNTYGNVEGTQMDEEEYFAHREELGQFVTENLLNTLLPTKEELEKIYGVGQAFEEDPATAEYTYSKELLDSQIFINYDTLDDKVIFAIAFIDTIETNGNHEFQNEERVRIRIKKENGKWLVDGFIASFL